MTNQIVCLFVYAVILDLLNNEPYKILFYSLSLFLKRYI